MKGTVHNTFASKADKNGVEWLGNQYSNMKCYTYFFWLYIQAFEVDLYLRALQCDVQGKRTITGLHIAQYILWPEVRGQIYK